MFVRFLASLRAYSLEHFGFISPFISKHIFLPIYLFADSNLGHYERQPQCPDVLRKQWRSIVEIPFLSLFEMPSLLRSLSQPNDMTQTSQKEDLHLSNIGSQNDPTESQSEQPKRMQGIRPITFFFSGRLLLWLPERVCSVRHVIGSDLLERKDTIIMNVTEKQSYGPISTDALEYQLKSIFCLVARSDSYSTAFFYDALQAGCIPVVIRYAHSYISALTVVLCPSW